MLLFVFFNVTATTEIYTYGHTLALPDALPILARRRDHGGVAFIDLREASGVVQVVIRDEAVAHSLRSEFCLKITGEVVVRKEGNENPDRKSTRLNSSH